MKTFTTATLKKIFPSVIILLLQAAMLSVNAQNFATYKAYPECGSLDNAEVHITIDPQLLDPGWQLPFDIVWERLDIESVGNQWIDSYEAVLDELEAGIYMFTIYFSGNYSYSFEVEVPHQVALSMESHQIFSPNAPLCCDGSIDLVILGGSEVYDYVWYKKSGTEWMLVQVNDQKSGTDGGLKDEVCVGEYRCIIQDELCAELEVRFSVEFYDPIYISEHRNVSLCMIDPDKNDLLQQPVIGYSEAKNDGKLCLDKKEGNKTFFVKWDDNSTDMCIDSLHEGIYNVTISWPSGCTINKSYNVCCCQLIEEAQRDTFYTHPMNKLCDKSNVSTQINTKVRHEWILNNGAIFTNILPSGFPYSFTWYKLINGSWQKLETKFNSIEGLSAGRYKVSVSDGCKINESGWIDITGCIAPIYSSGLTEYECAYQGESNGYVLLNFGIIPEGEYVELMLDGLPTMKKKSNGVDHITFYFGGIATQKIKLKGTYKVSLCGQTLYDFDYSFCSEE